MADGRLQAVYSKINEEVAKSGSYIRGSSQNRIKVFAMNYGYGEAEQDQFAQMYVDAVKRSGSYQQAKYYAEKRIESGETITESAGTGAVVEYSPTGMKYYEKVQPTSTKISPEQVNVPSQNVQTESGKVSFDFRKYAETYGTPQKTTKQKFIDWFPRTAGGQISVPGTVAKAGIQSTTYISEKTGFSKLFPEDSFLGYKISEKKGIEIGSDLFKWGFFSPAMTPTYVYEKTAASTSKIFIKGKFKKIEPRTYKTESKFYGTQKGGATGVTFTQTKGKFTKGVTIGAGKQVKGVQFPTTKTASTYFKGKGYGISKNIKPFFIETSKGKLSSAKKVLEYQGVRIGVSTSKRIISLGRTGTQKGITYSAEYLTREGLKGIGKRGQVLLKPETIKLITTPASPIVSGLTPIISSSIRGTVGRTSFGRTTFIGGLSLLSIPESTISMREIQAVKVIPLKRQPQPPKQIPTPRQTPTQFAIQPPKQIPSQTAIQTPKQTPIQTPKQTPYRFGVPSTNFPIIPRTTPIIPFDFSFPHVISKEKKKKKKKFSFTPPSRTPSLLAIGEQIKSTRKGVLESSGIGIRPIIIEPTKRRKKSGKKNKR